MFSLVALCVTTALLARPLGFWMLRLMSAAADNLCAGLLVDVAWSNDTVDVRDRNMLPRGR